MTIPFRNSPPTKQENFVPTVPLDSSAARLYGLSGQQEKHCSHAPRRLKRPWWRHLLQGLL